MIVDSIIKEVLESKKSYGYGYTVTNEIFIGYLDGRGLEFCRNTAENLERVRNDFRFIVNQHLV